MRPDNPQDRSSRLLAILDASVNLTSLERVEFELFRVQLPEAEPEECTSKGGQPCDD